MSEPLYRHVEDVDDIVYINRKVREHISKAKSRGRIIKLVKRSSYLIVLSHTEAWSDVRGARKVAKDEYSKTARFANRRLEIIGSRADIDEKWG